MKITYFGYAANPPTLSHAAVIKYLADIYDLVIVGPSAAHAFGKNLPEMKVRMPLSQAMLESVAADNVLLTNIEESLVENAGSDEDAKPVYSYTVLCALRSMYPNATIHLAVGPDNAVPTTWQRFYKYAEIDKHFGKVVVPDMGTTRSTLVRNMLKNGATIEDLTPHVGLKVAGMLVNTGYTGEK